MTISSSVRKVGPFTGTGTVTVFTFDFKVFQRSDLYVVKADSDGIETVLVLNTDYTASLNSNQDSNPGGSITLASALASGYTMIISSTVGNLQPTDLTNQGGFYPSVITDALDRATIQIQQLQEQVDRSAKLPITNDTDAAQLTADIVLLANNKAELDVLYANINDIQTVAADLNEPVSEINTVAGSITNVNTVGNNIANVNTVAGNTTNINTVAGNTANVTTVAGISGNVTTVAGISANVTAVANNATNINAVNANKANIDAVAGNNTNITAVAGNATNINAVNANKTNIDTVAGKATEVTTVAGIAGNVTTVAGISANVTAVANNSTNINAVAGNATNINAVNANKANIDTVAGDKANIDAVAGDKANIDAVAGDLTNINAVNANKANIDTVAGISSNVTTVAGISASVVTASNNVTAINDYSKVWLGGKASDPTLRNDGSALQTGDQYFNTGTNKVRVYSTGTSVWVDSGITFSPTVERFSGTGSQTAFTLSSSPGTAMALIINISGVVQTPTVDYTVSGTTLTFTTAPPSGTNNITVQNFGSAGVINVPADGSVTTSKIVDGSVTAAKLAGGSVTPEKLSTGRPYWDTSGNVGIGTTSPAQNLDVAAASVRFRFTSTTGTNAAYGSLANGGNALYLGVDNNSGTSLGAGGAYYAGIIASGNYPLTFGNNNAVKMTLDSSGNLGIGATPTNKLDVQSSGSYSAAVDMTTAQLRLKHTTFPVQLYAGLDHANRFAYMQASETGVGYRDLVVQPAGGSLLVGTTSQFSTDAPKVGFYSSGAVLATYTQATTLTASVGFWNPNGRVGYIATNGSTTTYSTSSDYRLKENIQPMTGALAKVAALKPCTYKWKADGSDGEGFIAHELAEVVPQCVTGEKDAVDAEGKPVYQGIDTSFLAATLTAAIQEQQAIIESLTQRIEALEYTKQGE